MSLSFSHFPAPFLEDRPIAGGYSVAARSFQFPANNFHLVTSGHLLLYGGSANIFQRFCGLKLWFLERLNLKNCNRKLGLMNEYKIIKSQEKDRLGSLSETNL